MVAHYGEPCGTGEEIKGSVFSFWLSLASGKAEKKEASIIQATR
jgi:hypothetical protein